MDSVTVAEKDDLFSPFQMVCYILFLLSAPLKTKHQSIHAAVKNGDVEEIIAMVKAGASINEVDQDNKFTPLHWAAHSGALEVISLLYLSIYLIIEISIKGQHGYTVVQACVISLSNNFCSHC